MHLCNLRGRQAPVAQLDRAPDYGSGGWGFDSLRARQLFKSGSQSDLKPIGTIASRMTSAKAAMVLLCGEIMLICLSACASNAPAGPTARSETKRGFFEKLTDEMTERECNVIRFTCPYGLGPAGEPCECTDPSGIVLNGRTIK